VKSIQENFESQSANKP